MAVDRRVKRAGFAGIAIAGGVASAIAAERALARRYKREPDRGNVDELLVAPALETIDVPVSDGGSIRVVARGEGAPMLLLHGITLSSSVWRYQLRDLPGAGYRVAAMDFRGHGDSVEGSDGLTLERLAKDVEEVLEYLGFTRAVLVGHSMGGMVALKLLAQSPELMGATVAALALVATSSSPARHRRVPMAKGMIAAARPLLVRSAAVTSRLPGPTLPANDVAFLMARATFGEAASPRLVDFTGRLTAAVPMKVSAALMFEIARFDEESTLRHVQVPTTVVVGDHDLMTPVAHARDIASVVPGAELVVLEGCGHMVMLERREELDSVLTRLGQRVGDPCVDPSVEESV